MKLLEIPINERPRERLFNEGCDKLSNEELLSIILKTGTKDKSVKELSLELLKECEDISNLKNMSFERLIKIKGIGKVKAIEILATIEIGKRIFLCNNVKNNKRLTSSKDIWESTKYLFYGKKQEYFYCLYFNNKQELIERKLLFMGTIDKSLIHPREVFKNAYLCSASSIICLHNHPSGDVLPSKADIEITKSLIKIGNIQGIQLVDHIIISENNYFSFFENNLME